MQYWKLLLLSNFISILFFSFRDTQAAYAFSIFYTFFVYNPISLNMHQC